MLPARIGGLNRSLGHSISAIECIQENHAWFAVVPRVLHDLVIKLPGREVEFFNIYHHAKPVPGDAPGLHLLPAKPTKPRLIGMLGHCLHKFISHTYRNIEIANVPLNFFAMHKIQNIRMIHWQNRHVCAVPTLLLDHTKSLIVDLQERNWS